MRRLVCLLPLVMVIACGQPQPPATAPAYDAPAPILSAEPTVTYTARRTLNADARTVARWIDEGRMADALVSTGHVTKPERFEKIRGTWPKTGALRRAIFEDGHYAAEQVLENTGRGFSYQIWGFTSATGNNVLYGRGEFIVTALADGSALLEWTYALKAKNPVAAPFVRNFVENRFSVFMETGMDRFVEMSVIE